METNSWRLKIRQVDLARPGSQKRRGISRWGIDECCEAPWVEHCDIPRLENGNEFVKIRQNENRSILYVKYNKWKSLGLTLGNFINNMSFQRAPPHLPPLLFPCLCQKDFIPPNCAWVGAQSSSSMPETDIIPPSVATLSVRPSISEFASLWLH